MFSVAAAMLSLATVLGKQVFDLTGSELDLGLLGLAEFAPSAILVLVTGTLADRLDRRRMASTAFAVQAAVVCVLAWYSTTEPTSVVPIFLLVLAFGTARAFGWPPLRALPPDLVPADRLPWLTVRYAASVQIAMIVGPVVGGFLYAIEPVVAFLASAAFLLVGAAALRMVQLYEHPGAALSGDRVEGVRDVPEPPVPVATPATILADATFEAAVESTELGPAPLEEAGLSRWQEALEGLRFIRTQPMLLGAISLDLFAVLFGGAVALLPAIAEERLGVGAVGLGWLRAATGIGAGAMTIFLAVRPLRRHIGRVLFASVAVFGVGTIALGVTTSFVIAFAALVVLSAADSISVFIRATLVPLVTPAEKRGRVLAVETVFIGASNELGAFESGVAGQVLGPGGAVVLGGAATLVIAVGWSRFFPSLAAVDRFPGLEERGDSDAPEPGRERGPARE